MSLSKMVNISLMGRTGAGKSSLGNLIFHLLGGDPNRTPFSESSSTHSHTRESQSVVVNNVKITDHPGLVDSDGASQDEKNIASIVNNLKEDKYVHGFLLVINEEDTRFDWAMQSALKLIVDSFGRGILSVMGVVFTHSSNASATKAQKFVTELRPMIAKMTGELMPAMQFWQVDCHPEVLWDDEPDVLASMMARNQHTVQELCRCACSNRPLDVSKAVASEYETTKCFRECAMKVDKLNEATKASNERASRVTGKEVEKTTNASCHTMSLSKMVNISLMGKAGDGKSSLGNLIFHLLGGDPNRTPFSESSSTHS
eukprot:scaffold2692_cov135-Ochromonas_danica.AAC.1